MSASKDYFENLTAADLFKKPGTVFVDDNGKARAIDIVPPEHQAEYLACKTEEERAAFMARIS